MNKSAAGIPMKSEEIKKLAKEIDTTEFWQCVRFADTTNRFIEITTKKDNISRLQGVAMYSLILQGGEMTPTQMAQKMFRSKHSMTKIIDSLEKEGLVVRDNSSKDRRVTCIKITQKGLDYAQMNVTKGKERAKQVMGSLTPAEMKQIVALTNKVGQRMTDLINGL